MEVKAGYKQTEVGVIPEDWEVVTVGAVCELVVDCKNRTPPVVVGGEYAVVRTPNVREGKFVRDELRFTDKESYRVWTARAVPKLGDVLITREAPLGEVCLVPPGLDVCLGQRMMLCRADRVKADYHFLLYSLMSAGVQNNLQRQIGGSTVGHVKVDDIRNLPVPLPPTKAEQQAIAEALSDADALIESLERLVAKKRQIKQGAMQWLLSPPETTPVENGELKMENSQLSTIHSQFKQRLPGFGGEWEERTLFELADGKKELFDDGDWIESEHITGEGVRLVQTGNIGVGVFVEKEDKKYIFKQSFVALRCKEITKGDLLICRLADPAGRSCVLPDIGEDKIVTSVDVTIFRPPASVAHRVFLANLFSTDQWLRAVSDWSGGTTHKRISRGALGRMAIRVPCVEEQTAIATILSDMDAEIATLETKLAKARQVKQGMMQELLTGQVRLMN